MIAAFLRITLLTFASIHLVQTLVLQCSETDTYYDNSRNCTFQGVIIDDVVTDISFSSGYRYNTPFFFKFVNSKLIEIPKKIFESYSTVKYLDVSGCDVGSVNRYTFERASELLSLNLSTNSIQELKNHVFGGAYKMYLLDLSRNNISSIEEKSFNNLVALNTLLLTGNQLQTLADNVFAPLINLRKLSLARNSLQILQKELLQSNKNLTMLFAQNNELVVLDKDLFANVQALEYLWLKNNNLSSLELDQLVVQTANVMNNQLVKIKLSPGISQLYVANNSISEITADDYSKLSLKTLDIAWNNLKSMDMIGEIASLEVLDLSHSNLGPLKLTNFAKLTKLVDLNLEDTKITNLQHGTFSHLTALKRLDISYNNLNRIDLEIFTSSHLIEEMFIDGNRLKEINYEELPKIFPSLLKLSIADNRWNCSFLTRMIRGLNTQKIEVDGFKSEAIISDKTNVKGIYCTDDTNPIAEWNVTAKRLDKYLNDSVPIIDTTEIKQIMQNAIDEVSSFNEQKGALTNKTELLEGEIYDLTKKLISLENDIHEVKTSILNIKLAQLTNATNETYVTSDLKKMMQELNDLTLAKLKHTGEDMEFKIYQQSFKIDKFIEKINENAGKLLALSKQLTQSGNPTYPDHNLAYQALKSPSASSEASSSQVVMILILVILVALLVIVLVVVYRNRLAFGTRRGAHYGTANTLATMMDNDI